MKRVYDEPERGDGARVLVDRLWPRGVRKDELAHDLWLRDVAPSTDLRTWYGHRPDRFEAFARRYREELDAAPAAAALEELRRHAARGPLTLLTATRDVERSAAAVLADVLRKPRRSRPASP